MTNDNQGYEIACTYANTYVAVRNIYEMRSLQNIHCYSISKYITSSQGSYLYDYDNDGKVDLKDACEILKKSLGI